MDARLDSPVRTRTWAARSREVSLLDRIEGPADLRRLPRGRLSAVAAAVRAGIVEAVSRSGGHLGASLGAVELTTALHYAFDTPRERLVFDVGHQGYAHKLLTGRRRGFESIGRSGGIGKFLRRAESPCDVFGAGHAGTSVSAAVGIAEAIRRRGGDEHVVAVIGDGALTAGMAYEGLNNAGFMGLANLVVVLNDNGMSISPNVGALSGSLCAGAVSGFFGALGFEYVGPVDGHDVDALVDVFHAIRAARDGRSRPVLVHCRTVKGRGYAPAQRDPVRYHGVSPFEPGSGRMKAGSGGPPSWTAVFADALVELARADHRIVGITAAMADGTGLARLRESLPERFHDVGIAEQHAVTMAAGMATEGLKPVCAIYSTFLQRAYDQIVHDVCVQDLDVTFALDRAGLVGADGATHQGIYDYAYLRSLPNMVVMAPKDAGELRRMLRTAIEHPGPAALRFPRGAAPAAKGTGEELMAPIPLGEAELLADGTDVALVAVGAAVATAEAAAERLSAEGVSCAVLNARFVKPLDEDRIAALARRTRALLTVEEHVAGGGFGEAVIAMLARRAGPLSTPCRICALPDRVHDHGDPGQMLSDVGLDAAGIVQAAHELLGPRLAVPATPHGVSCAAGRQAGHAPDPRPA